MIVKQRNGLNWDTAKFLELCSDNEKKYICTVYICLDGRFRNLLLPVKPLQDDFGQKVHVKCQLTSLQRPVNK